MKKHRCKECTKFCTDNCKYREDVDTMTFVCTSFEDRALYSSCEGKDFCSIWYDDAFAGVDLEKDKWTK